MRIYHSYYKFWRNFSDKKRFCWIAITKTVPKDYIGNIYRKLAPIGENFEKVENPFNLKLFFNEYVNLLKTLNKNEILNEIKEFSKNNQDIVLLNWEDLTKPSEGRFAYAWLFNLSMKEVNKFDLKEVIEKEENEKYLTGTNFLTI